MPYDFSYPAQQRATNPTRRSYGNGFENIANLAKPRAFRDWWDAHALVRVIGTASETDI